MIFEFKGISKAYGSIHALKNASLVLKSGEIRALLGGNGSGKSTLIKVGAGLVKQDKGELLFNGVKSEIHSPQSSKALKLAATSQELSILPNLTVEENITLCKVPVWSRIFTDRKVMRAETENILDKLGILKEIDTPIKELPINKQYLIEFGKAVFQDFDILMIDEITSALYREDVEIVKRLLDEYKRQNKIILFVSHRMSEIFSICDTVTVMRNGEVISTYNLEWVGSDTLLTDMIGNKDRDSEVKEKQKKRKKSGVNQQELLISVKGLPVKRYNTKVNLDIMEGEIIGIAGLQGHGQADIVRTLHGLSGSVEIELRGRRLHIDNPAGAVKHGFAYVSGDRERDGVFKRHDLSENTKVVQELALNKKSDVMAVLKQLNVKFDTTQQDIASLSGGNQQKVILGRWTHTNPLLLLADDPSKGIDIKARGELREILWALSEKGMAMIFVSSDEDELVALCSEKENARVIVLYEGGIVVTLRGFEITRDNIIAATLAKGIDKIP
ncbi:MAG: sugar ABC transporter ATP-binding protein [Treponema sp.]|jgi:ABC-type sugar transport system ATPase subunit|nr:sugar ABC transporter ATP-binding protein [Treponema sp.]